VQEGDLEAEEAAARLLVDELDSLRRKLVDRGTHVVDLVGDVMHARPSLGQELADRSLLAERGQELDTSRADLERRGLDALVGDGLAVLEACAEQLLVRRHRLVEILDGDPEVVDPAGLHAGDATRPVSRYLPKRACNQGLALSGRLLGQRHDLDGADRLARAGLGLDVRE
jgi:hypothetical protein